MSEQYTGHAHQKFGHITYSQHGEDLFLVNLFTLMGIDKPSYLDLGAHHPTAISNTALLYSRGSRGVNVECNPLLFEDFPRMRPGDKNLNIGVALVNGVLPFYLCHPTSAINSFKLEEIAKHGHVANQEIKVSVHTLDYIVQAYCEGKYPDLLLTDIEGLDVDVLMSADFSKSRPKAICTEVGRTDALRLRNYLRRFGYELHCRIATNLIFVQHYEELLW